MAQEIERKFLVKNDSWKNLATGELYSQGYIPTTNGVTIRVRVIGDRGYLTLKSLSQGISRLEFEYEIPQIEAEEILNKLCQQPIIKKKRYKIPYQGLIWEVDEFMGENEGLVLAEVELNHPDQPLTLPEWIGEEVSHDPRYYNANLAIHPYSQWK